MSLKLHLTIYELSLEECTTVWVDVSAYSFCFFHLLCVCAKSCFHKRLDDAITILTEYRIHQDICFLSLSPETNTQLLTKKKSMSMQLFTNLPTFT